MSPWKLIEPTGTRASFLLIYARPSCLDNALAGRLGPRAAGWVVCALSAGQHQLSISGRTDEMVSGRLTTTRCVLVRRIR